MKQTRLNKKPHGFTLVEILVVLVIATIVLSIAIPRIRTVNNERNMREASRVVGSAFANAAQRAAVDGTAGVLLTRNNNLIFAGSTQQFAVNEISLLRRVPNYTGDQPYQEAQTPELGASKVGGSHNIVSIPIPIEYDESAGRLIVRVGDDISFNNSNTKFRITSVVTSGATLELTVNANATTYPKLPETLDDVPFVVYRQPRVLRSSKTFLPDGYIIDLRYSGFEVLDGFGPTGLGGTGSFVPPYTGAPVIRDRQITTAFEPAPTDFTSGTYPVVENYDIEFMFDEEGSIDRIVYVEKGDEDGDGIFGERIIRLPLGPVYFLVKNLPDTSTVDQEVATADGEAFWVTVSNNNSAVNIGYNNPTASEGLSLTDLGDFYFNDRTRFNDLMNDSRGRSATSPANQ